MEILRSGETSSQRSTGETCTSCLTIPSARKFVLTSTFEPDLDKWSRMGDLIGFKGHENESAPFNWGERGYFWNSERRYHDFQPGTDIDETCEYPRFWNAKGHLVDANVIGMPHFCRDSEFDLVRHPNASELCTPAFLIFVYSTAIYP